MRMLILFLLFVLQTSFSRFVSTSDTIPINLDELVPLWKDCQNVKVIHGNEISDFPTEPVLWKGGASSWPSVNWTDMTFREMSDVKINGKSFSQHFDELFRQHKDKGGAVSRGLDGNALDDNPMLAAGYVRPSWMPENKLPRLIKIVTLLKQRLELANVISPADEFLEEGFNWRFLILTPAESMTTLHKDFLETSFYHGLARGRKFWVFLDEDFMKDLRENKTELYNAWVEEEDRKKWFKNEFPNVISHIKCALEEEGDMILCPAGIYHYVATLEDSLVFTENMVLGNLDGLISSQIDASVNEDMEEYCVPKANVTKEDMKEALDSLLWCEAAKMENIETPRCAEVLDRCGQILENTQWKNALLHLTSLQE